MDWIDRFGCCPDQLTAAKGDDNKGCFQCEPDMEGSGSGSSGSGSSGGECNSCDDTKFGCCSDGLRAAQGPNGEGCDSAESNFLQKKKKKKKKKILIFFFSLFRQLDPEKWCPRDRPTKSSIVRRPSSDAVWMKEQLVNQFNSNYLHFENQFKSTFSGIKIY